ncbi:hypothetical protein TL16_g01095 [Triparma laevis f. inornata]|uniref:Fe2OG dioxygenase domain-containing protein n=1 Tax=Triparma laevis f. inornata TaxID=1714386 RepID=A0A9W7DRB3_9STRA|nr:hypothetical protein TL16_g01095 [Triparma laevis f. inornata]
MSSLVEADDEGGSSDEALGELLGFNIGSGLTLEDDDDDDDEEGAGDNDNDDAPLFASVTLPPRCHRLPSVPNGDCFVLNKKSLVPQSLCEMIITLACDSFRYITEATHVGADGEKFTVPIASPNPHKLSMMPFNNPNYSYIYRRLKDLLFSDYILDSIVRSNFYERLLKKKSVLPQYAKLNHDRIGDLRSVMKLNPRLRVLRYDGSDDDSFPKHFDAVTESNEGGGENYHWSSTLTILLYLNKLTTDETGRTIFVSNLNNGGGGGGDSDDGCVGNKVVPGTGDVLIFEHDLMHSGEKLEEGETKFILRTDVMFMTYKDVEGGDVGGGDEGGVGEDNGSNNVVKTDFLNDEQYEIVNSLGLPESVEGFCKPGREVVGMLMGGCGLGVGGDFLDEIFEEYDKRF